MNTLTGSVYVAIAEICFQSEVINYGHKKILPALVDSI